TSKRRRRAISMDRYPGPGADFQHLGAVRQPSREVGSLLSVRLQLTLRSAHPRVPPGNRSFHLWTLESPSPRFQWSASPFLLYLTPLGAVFEHNTPNDVSYTSPTKRNRGESPNCHLRKSGSQDSPGSAWSVRPSS